MVERSLALKPESETVHSNPLTTRDGFAAPAGNSALAGIRMRCHQRAKGYVTRRISEGTTKTEIVRCLKRYLARDAYRLLTAQPTSASTPVARSGTLHRWRSTPPGRGEDFTDLADYLREYQPGGYPVARVKEMICQRCAGKTFAVLADDENGCAQARCLTCGDHALIADSADYWQDADPEECACPCGGEAFQVAVGFAQRTDGEVRWVSVGLRCTQDGTLGVYTDWKIDYSPTDHLLIGAA